MLKKFHLLRNVGKFDNVNPDQNTTLEKLTLIYAENGRGKTTVATILRSLGENNPRPIEERHRLGSTYSPHLVIQAKEQTHTFQNGSWKPHLPEITVFDDNFVAQNVCSGMEIDPAHRQNLHELVIGAQGVTLNAALQKQVTKIEEHNRSIREKEAAIPSSLRGNLSVDDFCALPKSDNIDKSIQEAQRNLEAAKSADAIKRQPIFQKIVLPSFDLDAIGSILQLDLPNLQRDAAAQVQSHLAKLGKDAESWVSEGMEKISSVSTDDNEDICPFCKQSLTESTIINHYQGYFSSGYSSLKKEITNQGKSIADNHHADIQTAFERNIHSIKQGAEFWKRFIEVPSVEIDTAEIARSWKAAREPILSILRTKLSAPLERIDLTTEIINAVHEYHEHIDKINKISQSLEESNPKIALVKEKASGASISSLNSDLTKLKLTQTRYKPDVDALCKAYLDEKRDKKKTEKARRQARKDLDDYRADIFQTYQETINHYLGKFLAGFRLDSMSSVNNRGGTSCTYNVLINDMPVPISAETGPSFKSTLSAGDRNTLALAFFFASLDKEPALSSKIVVIDDPMTSLDEHRSLATINEIIRLSERVNQVIILSHSKPFLCQLWGDAERIIRNTPRNALQIIRTEDDSTLASWNVHHDCITEHDKRHALIKDYIKQSDVSKQREVATALRPTVEAFLRVAYPEKFIPGTLLGDFRNWSIQALKAGNTDLLSEGDIEELGSITNYANHFHHDTNPAYATEIINDQVLLDYCKRTLKFTRRG